MLILSMKINKFAGKAPAGQESDHGGERGDRDFERNGP